MLGPYESGVVCRDTSSARQPDFVGQQKFLEVLGQNDSSRDRIHARTSDFVAVKSKCSQLLKRKKQEELTFDR